MLSGLSFPSLLSLTLGTNPPDWHYFSAQDNGLWHTATFAQINVHSLKKLTLFNVSVQKESLIAFLCTTPKLKSFMGLFPFDYGWLFKELSLLPEEASDDENAPHVMPFLPNLSKLLIYQGPSYMRKVDVTLLACMVRIQWRPHPLADDLNPVLGGGLTSVFMHSSEEGTLLKAQIMTALWPFSKQGLIIGVSVEPKCYQFDLKVDWWYILPVEC